MKTELKNKIESELCEVKLEYDYSYADKIGEYYNTYKQICECSGESWLTNAKHFENAFSFGHDTGFDEAMIKIGLALSESGMSDDKIIETINAARCIKL